jgi:ferrous iron transport protein A
MNLEDVALGVPVTVAHVGGERPFRRRLMELGILPGTEVVVVRVAPLGDPMELRVRGCHLSIRRGEARAIAVTQSAAPAGARALELGVAPVRMKPGLPASP